MKKEIVRLKKMEEDFNEIKKKEIARLTIWAEGLSISRERMFQL
jgi:hypothetical protein